MRKSKIVGTLGPASSSLEKIGELMDAGLNVVRLNFSHGTHEDHARNMERVREAAHVRDRMIPIIADLQGPKIRVGKLVDGGPVTLQEGAVVRITNRDAAGTAEAFSIDYPALAQDVKAGDAILLDDGNLELRVTKIEGGDLACEVVVGGALKQRKGVNVPGAALQVPSITEKDKEDLRFALSQGVDYIALSFVRRAKDVKLAKNLIDWAGAEAHVIAKLEKPQALDELPEILDVADAVMVARGDLGVELSPWQVPPAQKRIIQEASRYRKPVITATQMLESMIHNPRPTRAEASDVANAVFDGSDALMLSGETAAGKYPVEAVRMMSKIIESAESAASGAMLSLPAMPKQEDISSADMAHSATRLAEQLGARYIAVYSESGYSARLISKHRPTCPVLALSRHEKTCHLMKMLWGVRSKVLGEVEGVEELVMKTEAMLLRLGWGEVGDGVIFVAGTPFHQSGNTNLIRYHRLGDV